MEISGKIVQLLALQSGTGKNGVWKKQEFILETSGEYPKKVCFSLWGDKIDQSPLNQGTAVKVSFDIESREYNGKWYTDAKAWKVEAGSGSSNGNASSISADAADAFNTATFNISTEEENDLPF
jgi:hypothetical protein